MISVANVGNPKSILEFPFLLFFYEGNEIMKVITWFIPLSSKIQKYQKIIDKKIEKYGDCKTILIKEIAGNKETILIQNAFSTLEKYIQNRHTINGKVVKVPSTVCKEILNNFKYMLSLKENGLNLFFTDNDSIKTQLLNEL